MSDANLRSSLIRLASAHPEFRSQLLPLLAVSKTATEIPVYTVMSDVIDAAMKLMRERGSKAADMNKGGFRKMLVEAFDTVPHGSFNSFEELSKAHSKHLEEMEAQAKQTKTAGTGNTPFELWTTKALLPLLKRADHQVTGVTVETDKNKMVISMEIPDASDAAKKETEGDPNTFRNTFLNNVAQEPIEAALQKFFGTECTIGQGTDSGDGVYQVSITFSR